MSTKIKTPDGWKDVAGGSLTPPEGFIQNVDTSMQPVEDGKVMRISKTAFDALAQRDTNVMYYLDEEHDLIDAKPTCRDADGNLVKNQKIVELTKEQYDALAVKDPDTYYMIADDTIVKAWHPRPDWANAVTISADQLYAGYTAPSDGMFVCTCIHSATATITVNNVVVSKSLLTEQPNTGVHNSSTGTDLCVPVSKSDIIKSNVIIQSEPTNYNIAFIPWKA